MPDSMNANTIISARALLARAEFHTEAALRAGEARRRLVNCELAQRYTLQALAVLSGPCGITRASSPAPRRRATDERTALLPEAPL